MSTGRQRSINRRKKVTRIKNKAKLNNKICKCKNKRGK